jgi:hypothetical protein
MAKRKTKTKKMTDEDISGALCAAIDSAADYIDTYIAPDREEATRYYKGEPFGNEEEGRSQIVMSEVRDVVQAMMPSLMRVFMTTQDAVEFLPRRGDAVEEAAQATEYINYIFYVDNGGSMVLYDVLKDALIRKTGFAKYYVEDKVTVTEEEYTGLSEGQFALLTEDPELEIDHDTVEHYAVIDQATGIHDTAYDLTATRRVKEKVFKVVAVPPEEIILAKNARNIKTSDFVAHRSSKLVSELVAEGYDIDDILDYGDPEPTLELNQEAQARNPAIQTRQSADVTANDPSMLRVPYYESWIRMDQDGDGIAELHRICSIGKTGHVLHDEVVPEVPLALFCPDPEPHTAIGYSIADQTKDLQKIKSNIVRGTLDSLAQSIHPRTAVVEGQANIDDVMNTEIGGIIRMRQIGAVQPLETPFVGGQALPVLAYLDDVRAQRTGISRATQGLDADVLQSTTQDAVKATVAAAESRLEMVARIFAEGGMRQLFCGLLRLVVRHQDKKRVVRLRKKWVEVDPRDWDAEMNVIVNVGIGSGDKQEKIAVLSAIMAKQEQALQTLGPQNPLVDMGQLRNTMAKVLELSGIKDVESYWKEVTPDSIAEYQKTMQQNQKPDPAEILAQIEGRKTDANIEMNRRKTDLEYMKAKMDDDRMRDQMEADILLRAAELEFKYHGAETDAQMQETMAKINQSMARERMIIDTAVKVSTAEAQSTERAQQAHDQQQQQLAQQQAQAAAQQAPAPAPQGTPVQ